LKPHDRELFDKIFEDEIRKKTHTIIDETENDKKHLELVNFCANIFVPGSSVDEQTGYKLVVLEPLYSLDIKNFDFALLRIENASLILVECKHSVSDAKNLVEDTFKAVQETLKNQKNLENVIGNTIFQIEFVLCVPALNAPEIREEVVSRDFPICVWGFDLWKREVRLFGDEKETEKELLSGRIHKDKNLNKLLFKGIKSHRGFIRLAPIIPSSHMCTILVHVSEVLSLEMKGPQEYTGFQYSDIYNVLQREMGTFTALTDEERAALCARIIETGLKKGILRDLTEDIPELNRKLFQFSVKRPKALARNTEKTYIERNARKLAEKSVIERFRRETGFKNLTAFQDDADNASD